MKYPKSAIIARLESVTKDLERGDEDRYEAAVREHENSLESCRNLYDELGGLARKILDGIAADDVQAVGKAARGIDRVTDWSWSRDEPQREKYHNGAYGAGRVRSMIKVIEAGQEDFISSNELKNLGVFSYIRL